TKIDGRVVNNFGTATVLSANTITFANAAIWNNQPGSTFLLPDGSGISNFFATGSAFNNAGTVLKTSPPGTATIAVPFNNTGSVQVQSGALSLTGGGTNSSNIDMAAGTVLTTGSAYSFAAGSSAAGAGTLQIPTFNTLTIAGAASISNLQI